MFDWRDLYRMVRVRVRQATGSEPIIRRTVHLALEYHGDPHAGWMIPRASLNCDSIVVDIGIGENLSFTQSIARRYGCRIYAFDPTPKALAYAHRLNDPAFEIFPLGISDNAGSATFFLPNNEDHVSGSLTAEAHVGMKAIEVDLIDTDGLFEKIGADFIDLLKIDIEGAEYPLIMSESFARRAKAIGALCVEFHHRWPGLGREHTDRAVAQLDKLGFDCAWRSLATNEEFLFVQRQSG